MYYTPRTRRLTEGSRLDLSYPMHPIIAGRIDFSLPMRLKYFSFREVQRAAVQRYVRTYVCYCVNLGKVLYDRDLKFLGGDVDLRVVGPEDWKDMQLTYEELANEINGLLADLEYENNEKIQARVRVLKEEKELWEGFSEWMGKIIVSNDALASEVGMRSIKSRVAFIYDQIICADEKGKIRLLRLILDHGDKCPDRAVVGLEKAEMLVELINSGEKIANVLVVMFKKRLIESELVPLGSEESLETYLYYSIHLSEILELNNKTGEMLHGYCAVKYSFDEIMEKLFRRMTVEDLLGFVSSNEVFRDIYNKEYLDAIEEVASEMNSLDFQDSDYNEKVGALNNKYERISEGFYMRKAWDLLISAGFIVEGADYEDPEYFPLIPEIFRKELIVKTNSLGEELTVTNSNVGALVFVGACITLAAVFSGLRDSM